MNFINWFMSKEENVVKDRWGEDKKVVTIRPNFIGILTSIFVVFLGLALVFGSWFIVSPGNAGIVTRAGSIQNDVYSEGPHFKMPLLDSAYEVNVKNRTFKSGQLDASSKDLQTVTSTSAITYYIPETGVKQVFRNYRTIETLEGAALEPAIEEVTKAVSAKYTAEELVTKRDVVRNEIISSLRTKLRPFYVEVKDVSITNFQFSKTFNDAIEAKVTAEQHALQAENDLRRIKIVGEQTVATAKANAEAIQIQSEAIQKQGGIGYVQLKFIEKWDGKLPVYGQTPQLFKSINP